MLTGKHLKDAYADETTGEIVCSCGCGRVLESKTYDQSKKDSASGDYESHVDSEHHRQTNATQHDGGLGTEIRSTETTRDKKKTNFSRMARLQKQTRSNPEGQRIIRYIEEITNIINQNNLSRSLLTHCTFYLKKCEKDRLLENKKTKLASICIVYLTCRFLSGYSYDPQSDLKQIKTRRNRGSFHRYYMEFKPCFDKNKRTDQDNSQDKFLMLERFCDSLNVSNAIRARTRSILQYCDSKHMFPTIKSKTWCATCIWIAVRNDDSYKSQGNDITMHDIADNAGISTNPIIHLKRKLLDNGTLSVLSLRNGIIKNIANYGQEYKN